MNMDKELETMLNQLQLIPERDEQTAVQGKAAFLKEAAQLKPFVSQAQMQVPARQRWFSFEFGGFKMRQLAMATAVCLMFFFVGGSGLVLAANQSLPGDSLYPVKRQAEEVRLAFSADDDEQLMATFIDLRLEEMEQLLLLMRYEDVNTAVHEFNQLTKRYYTEIDDAQRNEHSFEAWQAQAESLLNQLPEESDLPAIELPTTSSEPNEPAVDEPTPIPTEPAPIVEPEPAEETPEPEETAVPEPAPEEEPPIEDVCETDEECVFEDELPCDPFTEECDEIIDEMDDEFLCDPLTESCDDGEEFVPDESACDTAVVSCDEDSEDENFDEESGDGSDDFFDESDDEADSDSGDGSDDYFDGSEDEYDEEWGDDFGDGGDDAEEYYEDGFDDEWGDDLSGDEWSELDG